MTLDLTPRPATPAPAMAHAAFGPCLGVAVDCTGVALTYLDPVSCLPNAPRPFSLGLFCPECYQVRAHESFMRNAGIWQ